MPEIVERAETTLGKRVGPLPVAGWAAIVIGAIVVVHFLRGGSSSGVTLPDAFDPGDESGTGGGSGGSTTGGPIPSGTGASGGGSPTGYILSGPLGGASGRGSGSGTTLVAGSRIGTGSTATVPTRTAVR